MSAYLSLIKRRRGWRLFEVGRLLTFSAFKMGAYSRWARIRRWALIRINTVNSNNPQQLPTLQPCFVINTSSPGSTSPELLACKTRTFYHHLHQLQKPTIPAIGKWEEILQPEPDFNTKQWKTFYSPLISNK